MPRARLPRPSRVTLGLFLAVALASSTMLATLGWLLLKQDADLAGRRRSEQLTQAAYHFATATARPSLVPTPDPVSPVANGQADDVLMISLKADGVAVRHGVLLYLPYEPDPSAEPTQHVFEEGERQEDDMKRRLVVLALAVLGATTVGAQRSDADE